MITTQAQTKTSIRKKVRRHLKNIAKEEKKMLKRMSTKRKMNTRHSKLMRNLRKVMLA